MSKQTLVSNRTKALGLVLGLLLAASPTRAQDALGVAIPLPGQINDVAVDEPRGLVYAGNFSAGRVEVVSMATNQRIASFSTTPQSSGMSGMAVSPNGQWLVATNLPVTFSVPQTSGLTVVNLNDPSDRRTHALPQQPLGVAFGADNRAIVITSTSLQSFDPADGSLRTLFDFETGVGDAQLPVTPPSVPREIVTANLTASDDGRWVFGVAPEFVFSYQVRQPIGLLTIRATETLINPPIFNQVSAGRDGSYFMAGQLLMTNDLRVIADTPEAPEDNTDFIGGTGIDSNIATVYGSFDALVGGENSPDHPTLGVLQVMDADNLYVRQRFRLTERITGKIVPGGNGRFLYAVSDSGLLHMDIEGLADLPQLEINPADRALLFQFDFCNRNPITKTLRIESPPGGAPATFSLSVEPFRSSDRPAILFEPHQGVTPAEVQVTVDPGSLGPVQGTNAIPINIVTDAVNIPLRSLVISNLRDVDQRGEFTQVPGHIVHVLGDPFRDRFYALDNRNFRVVIFDSNDMRQIGELRTGNSPIWQAMSRDGRFLVVANSRGENVTLINLDQLRVSGPIYNSWQLLQAGHYPVSLAVDNANVIMAVETSEGDSRINTLNLPTRTVSSRETLGVFTNSFSGSIAVAGSPDGNAVLVASSNGTTALWEAASSRLIVARSDFNSLSGAVGGGANYFVVGNHILNSSLAPLGDIDDASARQESSGFEVLDDGVGARSIRPVSQVDTGVVQTLDPRNPVIVAGSTRMAEPPPERAPGFSFSDTLSKLRDGRLISATSAGVVALPQDLNSANENPRIEAFTNAANFNRDTASGGLVSIFGERLSLATTGAVDAPLPTTLGGVCVSANGAPLPLLYVSPGQINAQMNFTAIGPTSVQVHTPTGTSDTFVQQVDSAAPAIFGIAGPNGQRVPAIFREDNTLSTLSNALRPNEVVVIYLTGLGAVSPLAVSGEAASSTILTQATAIPQVSFGGVAVDTEFAGLTPGFVGLYQINVRLPSFVPQGTQVPLKIESGANSTTVNVRIVE